MPTQENSRVTQETQKENRKLERERQAQQRRLERHAVRELPTKKIGIYDALDAQQRKDKKK